MCFQLKAHAYASDDFVCLSTTLELSNRVSSVQNLLEYITVRNP